jgi:hypothetical protein
MQMSINAQVITLLPNIGGTSVDLKPLNTIEADAKGILGSDSAATSGDKMGRNDKVIVVKAGEEKEIKWKKLDQHLKDGWVLK